MKCTVRAAFPVLAPVLAPLFASGLAFGSPGTAWAPDENAPLMRRAEQIAEQIRPKPAWPDDLFHPEFFKEITPARLRSVFIDYHAACGPSVSVALLDRDGPHRGRFRLGFEEPQEVTLTLLLETEPPHRVAGFFFAAPTPTLASLDELREALAALPGTTSVLVARLTDEGLEPLLEHAPDERLGVGSAFKLYVLGALIEDVAERRRRWNDTRVLETSHRSLPSGLLQTWPGGSPVTLHTLAALMISRSDNTATDHLIDTLGRTRVEQMFGTMGHTGPEWNEPLLMTSELFRLRGAGGGEHADRYLALEPEERRAYLRDTVNRIPLRAVDLLSIALPKDCRRIEWFASTRDLCRAMDWLRRATGSAATAAGRQLLAVNSGAGTTAGAFEYAGYKGGSTGGVLNHTWLLRTRADEWFAVSGTWNDPDATLDAARFSGLMTRALELLSRSPETEPSPDGD